MPRARPVLFVEILGSHGRGYIDSGAKLSVAGRKLYEIFQNKRQTFTSDVLTMRLADGTCTRKDVLITKVVVQLKERSIPTTFVILPESDNYTLFGIDFIQDAKIVVNAAQQSWHFADRPDMEYDLSFEMQEDCQTIGLGSMSALRCEEGCMLTKDERFRLGALISTNDDIFKPGGEATPYAEHRIDTGDHQAISVPPYRMSPKNKEILKKEIDRMMEEGIIEECESPWAAPVVLVPKKTGDMRVCVDYRRLNSVTLPDAYPLPRMDDLLHNAKRTFFMTTIDLRAGYHQVSVRECDRDKTAFVSPFGTFRYCRMPFGLRSAPATFQRLMDRFRGGLGDVLILAYLDDLIVLSSTFDEHVKDLDLVFARLRQFKLRANRNKCNFACSSVKYLGHLITPDGIQVDPEKTGAIANMAVPRNVKQVLSFLQTCSWYRRFVPQFADISRPLSQLTKKNAEWEWGSAQQASFESLKKLLVEPPILQQNDPNKPYILRTDASSYALGAVLLQGDGEDEHPIEYASRLLTPAERNYSTTEREALAVVWALNKFRGYVEGSSVHVTSDHQPLKWLMTLKSPTGRIARWALLIQSYNLEIDYIPGKRNVVADTLSRPLCAHDNKSNCDICSISIALPARSATDIRKGQVEDPELMKIIQCFEDTSSNHDEYVKWTERGYLMTNGVLYRYCPEGESEEALLVVPEQERTRVLNQYHDAPTAGHYGIERTIQRITSRYYWTGMRRYITEYVKRCIDCQRYKAANQKPAGLVQTPIHAQRFEVIAIDLFGPLPETASGEKWIFIVEDTSTKWVELFALKQATAEECARVLISEIFMRYGVPRKMVSDNGVQFVGNVMQKVACCMGVKQSLTPVYHPQANMVERKNRDLKPRLAILVGDDHTTWSERLSAIRFAMNTSRGETTGFTAAYLTFARELRTPDDVNNDLRLIVQSENFIPAITPYLHNIANTLREARDTHEKQQDRQKVYADSRRRDVAEYKPGDFVLVTTHKLSSAAARRTAKFEPRRDGPYTVIKKISPTTYQVANPDNLMLPIGSYHISALARFEGPTDSSPVVPIRKRGRPKKKPLVPRRVAVGTRGGDCNNVLANIPSL